MVPKLKSYLSVFFLAVFLTPTIVKEVHSICHNKEFHCNTFSGTHLHIAHHDCTLCNFVIPVIAVPAKHQNNFTLPHFAEYIFPHSVQVYFSSSRFSSASLRAPPFC
jgi:hypothetical protein